ncbi:MAG: hypothetical protein WC450_10460, partial [Candidatus Omnitrophota bacterium]
MAESGQTLTIDDVAGQLGIARQVADRWLKKHSVPRIRVGKRYLYLLHGFPGDFQNRWLAAHPHIYNSKETEASPEAPADADNHKEGGNDGNNGAPLPAPVPAVRPPSLPLSL